MEQTGHFDEKRNVRCDQHNVVVNEVEHAVGGVHLCGQLSKNGRHQNQGDARVDENLHHKVGHVKNAGAFQCRSTHVDDKDDKHNKELPTDDKAFQVVSFVSQFRHLQRFQVRLCVERLVHRLQPNETALSSFHDGQPKRKNPKKNESNGCVDVCCHFRLICENSGGNDDDREE